LKTPFNPTVVRLRHSNGRQRRGRGTLSIPLWCDCDLAITTGMFRHNLLSIPLWCDCDILLPASLNQPIMPFNPTVVRLRLRWRAHTRLVAALSIPLWCDCDHQIHPIKRVEMQAFNPTVVRLRPRKELNPSRDKAPFNPTVVRLRPDRGLCATEDTFVFQSHCGAIATRCIADNLRPRHRLSIPLWCDCDARRRNDGSALCAIFQSHCGAIATI